MTPALKRFGKAGRFLVIDVRAELAPIDQQFVQLLAEGWTPSQVEHLARSWLVAEADIEAALDLKKDPHAVEVRTAVVAAMVNHAINLRMTVSTPAILHAKPAQLLDWIDWYETEADRLYRSLIEIQLEHPEGRAHGNPAWDAAFAQFHRVTGFLWEAREQAGLNRLAADLAKLDTPATSAA